MRLARSKETEHDGIMISKETGSHDPAVYLPSAVPAYTEVLEPERGSGRSEYSSPTGLPPCIKSNWSALYKKPAGLNNIFHPLSLVDGSRNMASLNLDRCLNIPDDYQGEHRFDFFVLTMR